MKLREIFAFEFGYQARNAVTWLVVAAVLAFGFSGIRFNYIGNARGGEFLLNSSFAIANVTLTSTLIWLILSAPIAGASAARDIQTRMHPLIFTAPVSKFEYLGGRFLAAFLLNALILLAAPAGVLLALLLPGIEPAILGSFRPAAYLSAYVFIALPNAFVGTAMQFSFAVLSRRVMASYLGTLLLLIFAYPVALILGFKFNRNLGVLMDPIGTVGILSNLFTTLTAVEKNTVLVGPQGFIVWNRFLWLGIALAMIAFTYVRYRFGQDITIRRSRRAKQRNAQLPTPVDVEIVASISTSNLEARQTFGFTTNIRQALFIAWASFLWMARSRLGLLFVAGLAILAAVAVGGNMEHMGVPRFPRTADVLDHLTAPLANNRDFSWFVIPLLILFHAGELIWRERDARLSEIANTVPAPEWVFFGGKFLGLSLVIALWMAVLLAAGVIVQASMGYGDIELGLYLLVMFGLQLANYLLFALLVLTVHVLVNEKYIGHVVGLAVYGFIALGALFVGIRHNLLVYGADPGWSYTDMRGFGPSIAPWLWFKLYWAAWALLLAVASTLFWVRSTQPDLKSRFQQARQRFTRPVAGTTATAVGLVLTLGGFIFYNTNVLNEYSTASQETAQRAEYEKRYGRYENVAQPQLTDTKLRVDLYPRRRQANISGTYRLANNNAVAIDSIHVATASQVETGAIGFDRPATLLLAEKDFGHRIYRLATPLRPGESLRLRFNVQFRQRGFSNSGSDASVVEDGSYFTNAWLPAIGFQTGRLLYDVEDRKRNGLAPRHLLASVYDTQAQRVQAGADRTSLEVVVGTDGGETAVVQGALRRTWTQNGRRYFHYSTDAPVGNSYSFLSAKYAVHAEERKNVAIRILYHPAHDRHLGRMLRAVRASLDYYGKQFGPYPYRHLTIVARPQVGGGLNADGGSMIDYGEQYSFYDPAKDPRGIDFVFAVMGHEMAHSWWGSQVSTGQVEGGGVLVESLAWYSALRLTEDTYGREHLRRLLRSFLEDDEALQSRAAPPLLQAGYERYQNYRKGPLAIYAASEYIGKERVHLALRRLVERFGAGAPPLPTSLDLYRELQAVTPGSLQYLLHDLFEANTFWELRTEQVTTTQTKAGTWQVTLDVEARKLVVARNGTETSKAMNDWVDIGVFVPAEGFTGPGRPLYLQKHRIRSGKQSITVTVPSKPLRAGIDPYRLLIDLEGDDNIKMAKAEN